MPVRIRGRRVDVHVAPIRSGYFLRGHANEVSGIQPGSILDVDGASCVVKYLIAGDLGETEVWAILLQVTRQTESVPSLANWRAQGQVAAS
jgi:hypothetical protein